MHYKISYTNAYTQFITVEITAENIDGPVTYVRIPAWRPGRYELGNFAKNIRNWRVFDADGNPLEATKTERDRWAVKTAGISKIVVVYDYYAGVLNAGSTYLDENQLYMNPVNGCSYVEGKEHEACTLQLVVPEDYKVATGLTKVEGEPHRFTAANFDQLADRPFIASNTLKHISFETSGLAVNLWFQGECKPDVSRLHHDFKKFIDEQIAAYGEFPEPEYHFLFQITPHKTHHGVEHENSTVCMMGPTFHLFTVSYDEFLGLSSHEFYHSWNIKKIRPAEMLPYDFTKENYSRLGYVAEGVTTYYGDMMCYRAQVFTQMEYFACLEDLLEKHFHNYGRLFMPVAEASFDTWVDGYEPGVPHRKTSIYTEGALCALMTDIYILEKSGGKYSLDNVMYDLYHEYAKKGKGYTEADYKGLIEKYLEEDYTWFFQKYINGCENYEPELKKALALVGLDFVTESNPQSYEKNYGCKISEETLKVTHVAPGSPAEIKGLLAGEVVASVNGFSVNGTNLKHWFNYFKHDNLHLRVRTADNRIRHIELEPALNDYYAGYRVKIFDKPREEQANLFKQWTKNRLYTQYDRHLEAFV